MRFKLWTIFSYIAVVVLFILIGVLFYGYQQNKIQIIKADFLQQQVEYKAVQAKIAAIPKLNSLNQKYYNLLPFKNFSQEFYIFKINFMFFINQQIQDLHLKKKIINFANCKLKQNNECEVKISVIASIKSLTLFIEHFLNYPASILVKQIKLQLLESNKLLLELVVQRILPIKKDKIDFNILVKTTPFKLKTLKGFNLQDYQALKLWILDGILEKKNSHYMAHLNLIEKTEKNKSIWIKKGEFLPDNKQWLVNKVSSYSLEFSNIETGKRYELGFLGNIGVINEK